MDEIHNLIPEGFGSFNVLPEGYTDTQYVENGGPLDIVIVRLVDPSEEEEDDGMVPDQTN
jgi:hypothetical protein